MVPVAVKRSYGVNDAFALIEQRRVSLIRVEMTVVEEVVLIPLVALDALQPALHGVH